MAQITIEVPDEFAQRLEPFQAQLPELFTRFISTNLPDYPIGTDAESRPYKAHQTHQEILEFLMSQPTTEQIVNFKVSGESQQRLQSLLQRNREGSLSLSEKEELDIYEQLDSLVGLLKVRAYSALKKHQ